MAQRASSRAPEIMAAAVDVAGNERVSALFSAQRSAVETGVRSARTNAHALNARIHQLNATITGFDDALKECGDLAAWTQAIASDVRDCSNAIAELKVRGGT